MQIFGALRNVARFSGCDFLAEVWVSGFESESAALGSSCAAYWELA